MEDASRLIRPVAHIETDFPEKFGVPRQSGLVEALTGRIILEPAFRCEEALRELDGFSHLWLIWSFSLAAEGEAFRPTVRPPRLGGNTRVGVFASRSPFRPNRLGLSCVKLLGIEHDTPESPTLLVAGADLVSGTPIYDIKPYVPLSDCVPDAAQGYTVKTRTHCLRVVFEGDLESRVPPEKREALRGVLAGDPRPGYAEDPDKIYGLSFAGWNVGFCVREQTVFVRHIEPMKQKDGNNHDD